MHAATCRGGQICNYRHVLTQEVEAETVFHCISAVLKKEADNMGAEMLQRL